MACGVIVIQVIYDLFDFPIKDLCAYVIFEHKLLYVYLIMSNSYYRVLIKIKNQIPHLSFSAISK